jgi:hypothetical protein
MKGTAKIKYVIETGNSREKPTDEDWNRIVAHARIFGWIDALLARRPKELDAAGNKAKVIICQTKLLSDFDSNRRALSLAVQFSVECEVLSVSFCVNKTDDRYLTAQFDIPLDLSANEIMRMLFYSPTENATNFRVLRSALSNWRKSSIHL